MRDPEPKSSAGPLLENGLIAKSILQVLFFVGIRMPHCCAILPLKLGIEARRENPLVGVQGKIYLNLPN